MSDQDGGRDRGEQMPDLRRRPCKSGPVPFVRRFDDYQSYALSLDQALQAVVRQIG
jgi:hypothetical protein